MSFRKAMQSRYRAQRGLYSEINVTPLVDIMLVLLVIFILTSPMLVSGIEVNLPIIKAATLSEINDPIIVSVNKEGIVYVEEVEVKNMQSLKAKLEAVLKEKKDTKIFVRGDKAVEYGKVMGVFTSVREAGFNNVALVTEDSEDSTSTTKSASIVGKKKNATASANPSPESR